jgi:hypothetical protein
MLQRVAFIAFRIRVSAFSARILWSRPGNLPAEIIPP